MRLNKLILIRTTLKPFNGICNIYNQFNIKQFRSYGTEELDLSNNKIVHMKPVDKPTIARTVGNIFYL